MRGPLIDERARAIIEERCQLLTVAVETRTLVCFGFSDQEAGGAEVPVIGLKTEGGVIPLATVLVDTPEEALARFQPITSANGPVA